MQLLLLGTAAAEGWPAPFCVCPICDEARVRGGPNIRSRSGALIDDDLKIDFGPDTISQLQRARRNLSRLRTIIFTHEHTDHFVPSELEWLLDPFTKTPPPAPIEILANSAVLAEIRRACEAYNIPRLPGALNFRQTKPGDHLTTAAGDDLWIMPADHCDGATVFRLRRRGQTIFYGHDSGLYPPPTLDRLSDGIPLDIALMDCTNGGIQSNNRGHMDINGVIQITTELRHRRAITDATRVIATHFSHNGGLLHEELVRTFLPHHIEAGFDGMVIKIN